MEQKYDQRDWETIVTIHVELGCNVSETLRIVRTKFPQYAHLARKTFEEYLDSEEGEKKLAEVTAARQAEIAATLARNREQWNAMSLYRLWEECARQLLMRALAGDRDAERKAVQYLRLANSMLKAAQFDKLIEEDGLKVGLRLPQMQDLVAQTAQPCGAGVPPAPALSAGKMPAPQFQASQNCGAGVPACAPCSTSVPACAVPSSLAPNPSPLAHPSSAATLAGILACAAACTPASPSALARKIASAVSAPRQPASAPSTNHSPERLLATDKHR
ncbi:MAG: hypothetical protein ABSE73_10505 [Planctomycetota bacterium]